jgi:hypothetical protein
MDHNFVELTQGFRRAEKTRGHNKALVGDASSGGGCAAEELESEEDLGGFRFSVVKAPQRKQRTVSVERKENSEVQSKPNSGNHRNQRHEEEGKGSSGDEPQGSRGGSIDLEAWLTKTGNWLLSENSSPPGSSSQVPLSR